MTRAHDVPAATAPDLESAIEVLRSRGLRASAGRRLVLEVLHDRDQPLTAEQIVDGLHGHSDAASVYRNRETLEGVREQTRRDHGWEARFTHFPIAGLCPDCAGRRSQHVDGHAASDDARP